MQVWSEGSCEEGWWCSCLSWNRAGKLLLPLLPGLCTTVLEPDLKYNDHSLWNREFPASSYSIRAGNNTTALSNVYAVMRREISPIRCSDIFSMVEDIVDGRWRDIFFMVEGYLLYYLRCVPWTLEGCRQDSRGIPSKGYHQYGGSSVRWSDIFSMVEDIEDGGGISQVRLRVFRTVKRYHQYGGGISLVWNTHKDSNISLACIILRKIDKGWAKNRLTCTLSFETFNSCAILFLLPASG